MSLGLMSPWHSIHLAFGRLGVRSLGLRSWSPKTYATDLKVPQETITKVEFIETKQAFFKHVATESDTNDKFVGVYTVLDNIAVIKYGNIAMTQRLTKDMLEEVIDDVCKNISEVKSNEVAR